MAKDYVVTFSEQIAQRIIALIEDVIKNRTTRKGSPV